MIGVLVVLNEEFEESLLMLTHWALLRGILALIDVATVAALPLHNGGPLEHLTCFQVAEKLQVSALVVYLNRRHATEQTGDIFEALFVGDLTKVGI